jgi:hypothetical protein
MSDNSEANSMCPSCGGMVSYDVCSCGFAFSTVLKCPQKKDNGDCDFTKTICTVGSLDWEVCPVMRGDSEG